MCVICVSKVGVKQPTIKQLRNMFESNPHGAGYMYCKDGRVVIQKGFMTFDDLIQQLRLERFGVDDAVVYHFRISTQANRKEMTHPFPLTSNLENTKLLNVSCKCGIAHNGIIQMTTDRSNTEYNDTALFITKYMKKLLHSSNDLKDTAILDMIKELTHSKWAIMDGSGYIAVVGDFIVEENGLLFSNHSYIDYKELWNANSYGTRNLHKLM